MCVASYKDKKSVLNCFPYAFRLANLKYALRRETLWSTLYPYSVKTFLMRSDTVVMAVNQINFKKHHECTQTELGY